MTNYLKKYILQSILLIAIVGALLIPHFIINVFGVYYNYPANWGCVLMLSILFLIITFNDK